MPNCQRCGIEISYDGICDSCANAQNQQQAPPPSGSGKGGIIAIIAVVVVIIVVLAAILVLFGGGGNSSPTGAMDSFVDNYNSEDWEGALHYTDAHFMSSSDFNDLASDMDSDEDAITLSNLEARYQEDMSADEIEDAEDTVEGMEEDYGIQIDNLCMVDFTMTADGDTDSSEMLAVKVDGSWYMVIFSYYGGSSSSMTTPLGLSDAGRTTTTFTMLISSAPDGTLVEGTQFSFTHDNAVTTIDNATVYGANGIEAASWTSATGWIYTDGNTADTLEFNPGMKIVISTTAVSNGDTLTVSSSEGYFVVTTYWV